MLSSSNAGWYLLASGSASQTLLCAKAATQSGRTMGLPSMSASISCGRVKMHSDHHGMQRLHGAAHTRGNASKRDGCACCYSGHPAATLLLLFVRCSTGPEFRRRAGLAFAVMYARDITRCVQLDVHSLTISAPSSRQFASSSFVMVLSASFEVANRSFMSLTLRHTSSDWLTQLGQRVS